MEIMLTIVILSVFTGITFWCWKIALQTLVRQRLYSCRDRVYGLVIDGQASMDEKPVRELVLFIHYLINNIEVFYCNIPTVFDMVMLFEPSFINDHRLVPIICAIRNAMRINSMKQVAQGTYMSEGFQNRVKEPRDERHA